MSAKRKHRTTNEYLKYLKGELSSEERYSFERDLEADPFEMEAMEGMEMIASGEAEEDLLSLHATLQKRLKRRRRRTIYSIAATVASILVVGTIFLNIYQLNPDAAKESSFGEETFLHEEPSIQGQAPEKEEIFFEEQAPEEEEIFFEEQAPEEEVHVPEETVVPEEETEEKAIQAVPEKTATRSKGDDVKTPEALEAAPQKVSKKGRAQETPTTYSTERVSGIMVKSSDSGLVDDMATLDEVVVVGQGVEKEAYATGAVQTVQYDDEKLKNRGAEPAGGIEAFKMYMEENIRFPAGDTISKREVVVLKFIVASDGTISHIKTLRSPGDPYTEEAIRLLKEGPNWNPAQNESGTTEDVVRMRIVFKR